jgi:hypothetical protein
MPNQWERIPDELFLENTNKALFVNPKVFESGYFELYSRYNFSISYDFIRASPTSLIVNGNRKVIKIKCGLEYIVMDKHCVPAHHFTPR